MKSFETKPDSMGGTPESANVLSGARPARTAEHSPAGSQSFTSQFIRALGLIKKHTAKTSAALDPLPEEHYCPVEKPAKQG